MPMWLRRKKVNRRLGRVHVLDVKLRSDQVRQARVRWGVLAFGVMLGTGFGLYVLWRAGDWALNQLVYQNPAFAIQRGRGANRRRDCRGGIAPLGQRETRREPARAGSRAREASSGADSVHRHGFGRTHSAENATHAGDGARSGGADQGRANPGRRRRRCAGFSSGFGRLRDAADGSAPAHQADRADG